ncbi:hypothetical protein FHR83_007479 [Actinoplanes campanulatus]|uniref:Uncharacterized protein n=1 Tax=Actinoplanes campanulatus TaxID=113559 RepID=A0A7W5APA8_9ACTN|nr:hypothetical protein [Actinoplanes campanulatus]
MGTTPSFPAVEQLPKGRENISAYGPLADPSSGGRRWQRFAAAQHIGRTGQHLR